MQTPLNLLFIGAKHLRLVVARKQQLHLHRASVGSQRLVNGVPRGLTLRHKPFYRTFAQVTVGKDLVARESSPVTSNGTDSGNAAAQRWHGESTIAFQKLHIDSNRFNPDLARFVVLLLGPMALKSARVAAAQSFIALLLAKAQRELRCFFLSLQSSVQRCWVLNELTQRLQKRLCCKSGRRMLSAAER